MADMRKKVVWLFYDADTAIGINNEGALVFSYNLEDIDHLPSGADIFNSQKSVMWVNLRQAFYDEIKSMYKQLRSTGALSYDKAEEMFESHQGKWPEAVFNEDAWFKYLAPLVEKGNATYLSMLQGSKESQRKWWLYNRFKYLDSKYNAGDSLNDFVELRGYAKGDITVTPYADIYASIKYGSYLVQTRAERGKEYTLPCPLDSVNDTEIAVYSASQLQSIGDLAPLKVGRANFSNATKIQSIKLGDASEEYSNGNLTELTLGNNALLRFLDVRNCPALTQPVYVSHCTSLEHVYFEGTSITGISLPNGGILKTLHLPGTLANLTIRNQKGITDFTIDGYDNISTLRLENNGAVIDPLDIVSRIPAGSRVRIIGFEKELGSLEEADLILSLLDTMRGIDENGGNLDKAQVVGTFRVVDATGAQIASIQERYPDITVTYEHLTSKLEYYTYDGSSLLYTETIRDGGDGAYEGRPTRAATVSVVYTFAGWNRNKNALTADANATKNVEANRTVYAAYTAEAAKYTATFARKAEDGGGTLQVVTGVEYGTTPKYTGSEPVYAGTGDATKYRFNGWNPDVGPIGGDTTYYAKFFDMTSPVILYANRALTEYINDTNEEIADYGLYQMKSMTEVETIATNIGANAFDGDTALVSVDLKTDKPVTIKANAFRTCTKMSTLFIRSSSVATLENPNAFNGTLIQFRKGSVYVPAGLVNAYQTDEKWKYYRICSMEDYPFNGTEDITDSWEEILAAEEDGSYAEKYRVGDTKKVTYNGNTYLAQIIAMDQDELTDGTGNAKLTWLLTSSIGNHNMNASGSSVGGWPASDLRSYIQSTVLPKFSLKDIIKTVNKKSSVHLATNGNVTQTSEDKLWIPLHAEACFGNTVNWTYAARENLYGTSLSYWLRSCYGSPTYMESVRNNGSKGSTSTKDSLGIVLGFCT